MKTNLYLISKLVIACLLGLWSYGAAAQCTISYQSSLSASPTSGYTYAEGWSLRNTTTSCYASNYYLVPQSAEYSSNGSTWSSYSGMNFEFKRTTGGSDTNRSDPFSISGGAYHNLYINFNVSPSANNYYYRVYFDIYDGNGNVLSVLPGGRLYTELYYTAPLPNLSYNSGYSSASANGTIVSMSQQVENYGQGDAGSSYVGYYLSTNTTASTSDYLIGTDYVGPLTANGGRVTETLNSIDVTTVSPSVPSGTYYLCFYLDHEYDVSESSETDNDYCHNVTVTIPDPLPNLTYNSSNNSASVSGTNVSMSLTVQNTGAGSSGSTYVGYYLSTNTTVSGSDYLIGTDYVSGLSIGNTTNESISVDVANVSSIPSGTYYLCYYIDHEYSITETSENDNDYCFNNTVTIPEPPPNLTYVSSANSASATGTNASMSLTVQNTGAGPSGSTYVGYYLSTNTSVSTSSDYLIGTDYVPGLSSGNTTNESVSVDVANVSPAVPSGTYFLCYFIDHEYLISETSENDNSYCFSNTVTIPEPLPNLTYNSSSNAASVNGTTVSMSLTVQNTGLGTTNGTSEVGYYLSSNTTVSTNNDYLIGTDYVATLSSGGTNIESLSVDVANVSPSVPSGIYYLCYFIDNEYSINETNENDNSYCFSNTVTIPDPLPNITNDSPYNSASVNGTAVTMSLRILNNGPVSTGMNFYVGYYLSSNTTVSTATDHLIGFELQGDLTSGGFGDKTQTIDVANTTPAIPSGTYYLCYYLDQDYFIDESDENDNGYCFSNTVTIQGTPITPQIKVSEGQELLNNSSYTINGSTMVGNTVDVEFTVENTGTADLVLGSLSSSNTAFSITVPPISPVIPNGSTTFTIRFEPTIEGMATTMVSIPNNDLDPFTFSIIGEAIATSSPYIVNPTSSSGLFWGQAQIDGIPAEAGDWIAALDVDGNVAGAAEVVINAGIAYINMQIYGDDPNTPQDEGMVQGGYFTLELFDSSENTYYTYPNSVNPIQFYDWANNNGGAIPTYSDYNEVYNFTSTTWDIVYLEPGWNLISFDVTPFNTDPAAVFSSLRANNLDYVTSYNQGYTTYDPTAPPFLNSLNSIEDGYGFWVKVGSRDTIELSGTPVDESFKVDLFAGPNLIGYLPQTTQGVEVHFSNLINNNNNLDYVTSFENGSVIFSPTAPPFLNSLTAVNNGQGYWVYVQNPVAGSNYRTAKAKAATLSKKETSQVNCSAIMNPVSGLFWGQLTVPGVIPEHDIDEIIAVNSNDNSICYGTNKVIVDAGIAYANLFIYGDNSLTTNIVEGILLGECFDLLYYDASEGITYILNSNFCDWANTNGTPMPSYSDYNVEYTFSDEILAVEILDFKVRLNKNNAALEWVTLTETNNHHFEIQRSANGIDFETIGEVKGNGTTTTRTNYSFHDYLVKGQTGVLYYQLKQVDFEGTYNYSKVISLTLREQGMNLVTVYPNPTSGELTISTVRPKSENTVIKILGIDGNLVYSNTISSNQNGEVNEKVDLSNFPTGLYIVQLIVDNETVHTEKISLVY